MIFKHMTFHSHKSVPLQREISATDKRHFSNVVKVHTCTFEQRLESEVLWMSELLEISRLHWMWEILSTIYHTRIY